MISLMLTWWAPGGHKCFIFRFTFLALCEVDLAVSDLVNQITKWNLNLKLGELQKGPSMKWYFQKRNLCWLALVFDWVNQNWKWKFNIWKYALGELQKGPSCVLSGYVRSNPNWLASLLGQGEGEIGLFDRSSHFWWAPKRAQSVSPRKRFRGIVVDLNGLYISHIIKTLLWSFWTWWAPKGPSF